jgi:hypothetical protein
MRIKSLAILTAGAIALASCGGAATDEDGAASAPLASDMISANTFGCIRDLEPVDRFFVGNLDGDLEATLAIARSETGGTYPTGSIVQLVPTEAMVKRAPGFSAETNDWEFFDLDISPQGTKILTRGHADVVNRFDGNCLECHAKAEEQWDMICSLDHGCDPIPINDVMIRALQKSDPRCEAMELTPEEQEGLGQLMAMMGG